MATPLTGFLSVLAEEKNGNRPSPQTLVRKVSQPPSSPCIAIIIEHSKFNNTANFLAGSETCCMEVQAGWGADWKQMLRCIENQNRMRDRVKREANRPRAAPCQSRSGFPEVSFSYASTI